MDIQYVGLIFAPSRRQISLEQAKPIIRSLRSKEDLRITGVYRNQPLSQINQAIEELGLDVIQLHGSETQEVCQIIKRQHNVTIIKVVSLDDAPDAADVINRMIPYRNAVDIWMLDTHDPRYGGGAGKAFRWEIIPEIREWVHVQGLPLFVAGGLHEQNVQHLIQQYQPDGVDISSGIETDGRKDIHKMNAFIERVKQA